MDKAGFWNIIDKSRHAAGGDPERQLDSLGELLAEMSPEEIVSFDRHLSEYHARAYHWDLWGAAYIIGGGCSDDGFLDFRGWLISRGEKVYEAAMSNADSLAAVVEDHDGECQVEGYQYIAWQAWEEKLANRTMTSPSTTCQREAKLKALHGKKRTWMPGSPSLPGGSAE